MSITRCIGNFDDFTSLKILNHAVDIEMVFSAVNINAVALIEPCHNSNIDLLESAHDLLKVYERVKRVLIYAVVTINDVLDIEWLVGIECDC